MLWTPPLSFDPFPCTEELKLRKKQPILRGKEVEGKLLIGYTEHSCVLLFPPEIPFVRSAEHCNRKAAPETNTYCKHWWQDLQKYGHLPESAIQYATVS